jgi:hypothetical protein
VTKSVTATLVGVAIQQGYLQGVDQHISDILPVPDDKAEITLEDLLTMRSGIACVDELTLLQMAQTADWSQFVLSLPVEAEPETKWNYCSSTVHLLAAIVQAATGQNVFDFAMQNLFEPLGIQNVGWPRDPQGVVHGWGDLRLTPLDMAKIGYLYLNNGMWDGHQLLPDGWVNDATRNIRAGGEQGYGYLWWLFDSYYAAQGRGGQFILVIPDDELIVVLTGGGADASPDQLLDQFILPAIKSDEPLATNDTSEAVLRDAVETVALAPALEAQPVEPIPPLAQEVSERTILLDPNPAGLLTFSLSFDTTDEAVLHITTNGFLVGDADFSWVAGLDGVPRMAPGRFDLPASATGRWIDDSTFAMLTDEIGNNNVWEFRFTFDADNVTSEISTSVGGVIVSGVLTE